MLILTLQLHNSLSDILKRPVYVSADHDEGGCVIPLADAGFVNIVLGHFSKGQVDLLRSVTSVVAPDPKSPIATRRIRAG